MPNSESIEKVWNCQGARSAADAQNPGVTENRPDWYFREWMAHFEKRQAALVNELGWNKQKASYIWNGKQSYTRDIVNEIAGWLDLEPYELLMPPAKALQLRAFEQSALQIAAESRRAWVGPT